MRDDFSTLDISKSLKIPRERLRKWMDEGYVTPSLPASGAGTRASFTRIDVYRIALFGYLTNRGFKRSIAATFVKLWGRENDDVKRDFIVFRRESGKGNPTGIVLLASPLWEVDLSNGIFYHTQDDEKRDVSFKPKEEWTDFVVVNFKHIKTEVDRCLSLVK